MKVASSRLLIFSVLAGLLFFLASTPTFGSPVPPELTISDSATGVTSVGFDGTNYLVVSCRSVAAPTLPTGIFGVTLSPAGIVLNTFHIASFNFTSTQPHCPPIDVAFDGTNYLVVYSSRDGNIFGARVTPTGTPLDGPDGFNISLRSVALGFNWPVRVDFDGTNYLVVWNQNFSGDQDILGARVSPDGVVLDEFPIFQAPGDQFNPILAFDGTNYLVAWRHNRDIPNPHGHSDIFGTRVTPQGVVLDPGGIAISTAPFTQTEPDIAFDGTNYLVVWQDRRESIQVFSPINDIYGTRITPDGVLLDGPPDTGLAINTVPPGKGTPKVIFDGTDFFVTWSSNTGILGTRVSTDGSLIDGPADNGGFGIKLSCRTQSSFGVISNGKHVLISWLDNFGSLGPPFKDVKGFLIDPTLIPAKSPYSGMYAGNFNGRRSILAAFVRGYYGNFMEYESQRLHGEQIENIPINLDGSYTSCVRDSFNVKGTFTPSGTEGSFSNRGTRNNYKIIKFPGIGRFSGLGGYYTGTYSGTSIRPNRPDESTSGTLTALIDSQGGSLFLSNTSFLSDRNTTDVGLLSIDPNNNISGFTADGANLLGIFNPANFSAEGTYLYHNKKGTKNDSGNWTLTRQFPSNTILANEGTLTGILTCKKGSDPVTREKFKDSASFTLDMSAFPVISAHFKLDRYPDPFAMRGIVLLNKKTVLQLFGNDGNSRELALSGNLKFNKTTVEWEGIKGNLQFRDNNDPVCTMAGKFKAK